MREQWWKNSLTGILCLYFLTLSLFPSALDGLKIAIGALAAAGLWHRYLDRKFLLDPVLLATLAYAAIALLSNLAGSGRMADSLKILSWTLPFILGKAYSQYHSEQLNKTLILGAAFLAAYMAVALALSIDGLDQISALKYSQHYLILTFRHITRTAIFVAVAGLICVYALLYCRETSVRLLAWPGIAILLPTLILTGRRMTVAAFLAVSALLLLYRKKYLILGIGLAVTVLGILVLGQAKRFDLNPERLQKTQSVVERRTVWYAGWQIFKDNPILGSGFGSFKEEAKPHVEEYRSTHPNHTKHENLEDAHNIILHVAAETGIIGVAAMLFIFFFSIWSGWSRRLSHPAALCLSACCMLIFMNSQLHVHLYASNMHGFLFLLMGMTSGIAPNLEAFR
jgi:O-antigen ligase